MKLLWAVSLLLLVTLIAELATAHRRFRPGYREQCRKFHLKNGKVKLMSRGRLASLSCKRGFNLFGGDRFLHCVGRMWIGIKPMCIGRPVPDAIRKCNKFNLVNGKVKLKFKGQIASLSCKRGYTMTNGDQFLSCVRQQWDGILPKCISTATYTYTTPFDSIKTTDSKEYTVELARSTALVPIPVSESPSSPSHTSTSSLSSSIPTPPAWEDNPLRDPDCLPTKHLVNLGLPNDVGYSYSATHRFILRCRGIHKKRACVATVEKEKHWSVTKTQEGTNSFKILKISYNDHGGCKYDMSTCSNPSGKRICQASSNHRDGSHTHYWDERTCECQCFVKINDRVTCSNGNDATVPTGINYGWSSYERVYSSNRGSFVPKDSLFVPVAPSYAGGSYGGDHAVFGLEDYDEANYDVVDGYNQGNFDFGGVHVGDSGEGMTCKMEDITLEVGATLKMNEESDCDILCSCNIPPEFTCDKQSKCALAEEDLGPSKCIFPFIYRDDSYSECTATGDPEGKLWCSTKTDKRNHHLKGNWMHC